MIFNDNDTDHSLLDRRKMMLYCLKEDAENITQEHNIMHRQHLEALEEHNADLDLLKEFNCMDRVHEFRTMFRKVSEAVEEYEERIAQIRELDYQFNQTTVSFVRICATMSIDPSIKSIVGEFCEILASFHNLQ